MKKLLFLTLIAINSICAMEQPAEPVQTTIEQLQTRVCELTGKIQEFDEWITDVKRSAISAQEAVLSGLIEQKDMLVGERQKVKLELKKINRSERNRRYRQTHAKKIAKYKHQYYQANKDQITAQKRQYNEKHRDRRAEYKHRYDQENKDRKAEYNRMYKEKHRNKIILSS